MRIQVSSSYAMGVGVQVGVSARPDLTSIPGPECRLQPSKTYLLTLALARHRLDLDHKSQHRPAVTVDVTSSCSCTGLTVAHEHIGGKIATDINLWTYTPAVRAELQSYTWQWMTSTALQFSVVLLLEAPPTYNRECPAACARAGCRMTPA